MTVERMRKLLQGEQPVWVKMWEWLTCGSDHDVVVSEYRKIQLWRS